MAGTDLALLLLKHGVTVVLVLLALRLMHSASAARRVFAARCGLVALLLLPVLWLFLPQTPVRIPLALSALIDPPLAIPAGVSVASLPAAVEAFAAPARAAQLGRLLLAVYVLGVLCHVVRLALDLRRLRRAAAVASALEAPAWNASLQRLHGSLGLRRPVRLLVSDAATSPYSWGLRHPLVVLDPRSAVSANPDAVLAHELAHIRAHDWPVLLLARGLLALYWWHPLMYPLVRALAHDTECAADDAVLAAGTTPSHYAHTLVAVSRHAFGGSPTGTLANRIAGSGATLVSRVAALLEAHRPRGRVTARQWWGGALATLALVCVIGSLKLRGEHVIWPDSLLAVDPANKGQSAAQLLQALGNPNFEQLAAAIRAGDFEQRHAVETESFRQRAAIPALLLAMRDPNPVVRRLAVWGLSEMRFPETAAAVAALLADQDAGVRAEAAGALGDMGETRWVASVIAMLRDENAMVRARAAHALGDLGAIAGIAMLEDRLTDPDPEVVEQARWALHELL